MLFEEREVVRVLLTRGLLDMSATRGEFLTEVGDNGTVVYPGHISDFYIYILIVFKLGRRDASACSYRASRKAD